MDSVYLLLGMLIFWVTIVVVCLVFGAIVVLVLIFLWCWSADWLISRRKKRERQTKKVSTEVLRKTCVDPSEAETAKLPALKDPE